MAFPLVQLNQSKGMQCVTKCDDMNIRLFDGVSFSVVEPTVHVLFFEKTLK